MTAYLTKESQIASYMLFPRFLLDMDLSESTKLLYMLLIDRSRLSMKNDGWQDGSGHVFIVYTIRSLAEDLHKSEMTIKNCLRALEDADLIERHHQGQGKPSRIFLKVPCQTDSFLYPGQTENCPPNGKNPVPHADRKLSTNKNYIDKTIKHNNSRRNDINNHYCTNRYEFEEGESL